VFVLLHQTQPNLPFDINRDLVPIGFIGEQPMGFAVAPALGVKTMGEFIAEAKKRPGEINYAASNRGTIPHLSVELLRARAGIDITFVPYTGSAKALPDLIGGRISMIVDGLSGLTGSIDGGQLKLLATGAPKRLPNFPDIPTVGETVPNYIAIGWLVMTAPARTPEPMLRKVRQDLYALLAQPELKRKFEELGTYPNLMTPAQLDAFLQRERDLWKGVLQQIGEVKQ
jgi:tripartite-type tricarboxylate transporter receptor subunit TctC